MPDIPNRSQLESDLARRFSKLSSSHRKQLLDLLGDPPSIGNVPQSFWEQVVSELNGSLAPFLSEVYMDSAERLVSDLPIGTDWALINAGASTWARQYGYDLVRRITDTSRRATQEAITGFFEQGMTRADLEARLARIYGPMRASAIAVTEVTRASVQGELAIVNDLKQQGIEMVQIWATNADDITCPLCAPLDGKERGEGWNDPPPLHVNCLPGDTFVLPIGRVAAGSKRWYEGDIVIIETLENQLTITPNHPILTPSGWVAAGLLKKGDRVLSYNPVEWKAFLVGIDNQNRISTIEDIFSSLDFNGLRVPTTTPDFHGDGVGSDIAIIRPNSEVVNNIESQFSEPVPQNNFIGRNIVSEIALARPGPETQFLERSLSTPASIVGGFDLALALLGGHTIPFDSFGLGLVTGNNSSPQEMSPEDSSADTKLLRKLILGIAGNISLQEVIEIRYKNFSGHVYNLQTESGLFVAAGIIAHNCRCWVNSELPKVDNV
jgi:hypothetical protein